MDFADDEKIIAKMKKERDKEIWSANKLERNEVYNYGSYIEKQRK